MLWKDTFRSCGWCFGHSLWRAITSCRDATPPASVWNGHMLRHVSLEPRLVARRFSCHLYYQCESPSGTRNVHCPIIGRDSTMMAIDNLCGARRW